MSVLIVTYNPEEDSFRACLRSILNQTYRSLEVVVVDNGSRGPVLERAIAQEHSGLESPPPIRLTRLPHNRGFAHGMNRAIAECNGPLCLLLNPDTQLEPTAIAILAEAASDHADAIGFAPKVRLAAYPEILDSLGLEFSSSGDAAQRGLGQPDLGQFDRCETIPGISMGAALVRREAFASDAVGLLDEQFFMFFEDVDWSVRACLYGYRFLTVPAAVIFHVGSESVRKRPFTWRYRLVERNVYYMAIKNFDSRHLARFMLRRTSNHLRKVARGRRPLTTIRLLAESWIALWTLHAERQVVQTRRRQRDSVLADAEPGPLAVDPLRWAPIYTWATLRNSLGRLYAVTGEERWARAYRYLELVTDLDIRFGGGEILTRLERLASPLPEAVRVYASKVLQNSL
ncbi:MAG TPA: glycosyltransferase family 2 protein [Candidatus Dormibacteraeota bacterium]